MYEEFLPAYKKKTNSPIGKGVKVLMKQFMKGEIQKITNI